MPSLAFKLGEFLNLEKSILQCVNMTAVGAFKKKCTYRKEGIIMD